MITKRLKTALVPVQLKSSDIHKVKGKLQYGIHSGDRVMESYEIGWVDPTPPINKGDWYYAEEYQVVLQADVPIITANQVYKVVACTQKLQGVLQINPTDIQAYCDNPYSEVEVEMDCCSIHGCMCYGPDDCPQKKYYPKIKTDDQGYPIVVKTDTYKDVHTRHCNQGEYISACKYGEDTTCTALKDRPHQISNPTPIWRKIQAEEENYGYILMRADDMEIVYQGSISGKDALEMGYTHYMGTEQLKQLPIEK